MSVAKWQQSSEGFANEAECAKGFAELPEFLPALGLFNKKKSVANNLR